jgi:NADH-ubiquinone oxidoreductase chain 2
MFTNSLNVSRVTAAGTNTPKNIHSIFINRITILTLLVSILLNYNALYFQIIGKGIGLYSGLFQITCQSLIIENLLLFIAIFIFFS